MIIDKPFSKMSSEELINYCRALYEKDGIESLSYPALKKHKALYCNLYRVKVSQKKLITMLGLDDEFKRHKNALPMVRRGRPAKRWSWERVISEAKEVCNSQGHLPAAVWFQENGYGSLVQAVYYLGESWESLREQLGDFNGSSFVQSRNGMRWRSHPEASLSNFLHARGIEHKRGERYPADYSEYSTAKYAYFDLHFLSQTNKWIDVEIWGDKPHGHCEQRYSEKRAHKEAYNADNVNFIGIHFKDCFKEDVLSDTLFPYIGTIKPFCFEKETDLLIHSTHWSNTDELLEYCRQFSAAMPNGEFPTEEWLRKRGKWENRPGETYNTLSVYIKTWLGGVRNLRKLLKQEHVSTTSWDKEKAIGSYFNFFREYGATTEQVRHLFRKGDASIPPETAKLAANISSAVGKYVGNIEELNKHLGIIPDKSRVWSRENIINGFKDIIEKYGIGRF